MADPIGAINTVQINASQLIQNARDMIPPELLQRWIFISDIVKISSIVVLVYLVLLVIRKLYQIYTDYKNTKNLTLITNEVKSINQKLDLLSSSHPSLARRKSIDQKKK
jgi:hypothetical protein